MLSSHFRRLANYNPLLNWHSKSSLPAAGAIRLLSTPAAPNEQAIVEQLRVKFPKATDIAVMDVSGGCGAMFEVYVEAPDFKGMRVVKQHQLVNQALESQIKEMHGLRISTAASTE